MGKPECRTKEGRRIIRAVRKAGGEVTITRAQHLRVKGPAGIAIVQAEYGGPVALRGALAEIKRHAGLDLRAALLTGR